MPKPWSARPWGHGDSLSIQRYKNHGWETEKRKSSHWAHMRKIVLNQHHPGWETKPLGTVFAIPGTDTVYIAHKKKVDGTNAVKLLGKGLMAKTRRTTPRKKAKAGRRKQAAPRRRRPLAMMAGPDSPHHRRNKGKSKKSKTQKGKGLFSALAKGFLL